MPRDIWGLWGRLYDEYSMVGILWDYSVVSRDISYNGAMPPFSVTFSHTPVTCGNIQVVT